MVGNYYMEKMTSVVEPTIKDLVAAVSRIPAVAKKEGRKLTLDRDEGARIYSPPAISSGTELYGISSEASVYLDNNANPRGIMIECYETNFLEHHKNFQSISGKVFPAKEEEVIEVDPQRSNGGEGAEFAKMLEKAIVQGAQEDL